MKFNQKETSLIIALIEGKRASDDMLRGFRNRNNAEKARDEFYDVIIRKVKLLSVK
jgi:hypothetical protein